MCSSACQIHQGICTLGADRLLDSIVSWHNDRIHCCPLWGNLTTQGGQIHYLKLFLEQYSIFLDKEKRNELATMNQIAIINDKYSFII